MHSLYVNMLLRNPVILFFDIDKVDAHTMLNLRFSLAAYKAETKVIRRRIFTNALRVAQYLEQTKPPTHHLWDPSGLALHATLHPRKKSQQELEMKALLKGEQTCAVTFAGMSWREIDVVRVLAVLRILERTGKTRVLGARVQRRVVLVEDLRRLREVESLGRSRAELAALLGGTAQVLAGTLSAPAGGLAFTLEGRKQAMEEEK
jgi:ribosomal protein L10